MENRRTIEPPRNPVLEADENDQGYKRTGTKRRYPAAARPTRLDIDSLRPIKKRKRSDGESEVLVFEDHSVSVPGITKLKDRMYNEFMQQIYSFVNTFVKGLAFRILWDVVQWAWPVAEEIERIWRGRSLRQGLKDLQNHLEKVLAQAGIDPEKKCWWACFSRCVSWLAGLMQRLYRKYRKAKKVTGSASIRLVRSSSFLWELQIVSGYCVGKGCGFESPNVLQPSAIKPGSPGHVWGNGKDYYTNLCRHFDTICSVYSTWNFLELGKKMSNSAWVDHAPQWVVTIADEIWEMLEIDTWAMLFLEGRWVGREPWIAKKTFGKESNVQRRQIDQLQSFHRGIENIPSPLLRRWSTGIYRTPAEATGAMATELGFIMQRLWYTGEYPPPPRPWDFSDFPARPVGISSRIEQDREAAQENVAEGVIFQNFR